MPRTSISSDGLSVGPGNSPQLLRQLVAGRMNPHRVSRHDAAALISYCRSRVHRQRAKIASEVRRGRFRIARRMQRAFLKNFEAKLVVAWEAARKIDHRKDRRRPSPFVLKARRSFLRIWRLALAIDRRDFETSALVRHRPKVKGGSRPIYTFDQLGIARQKLADEALKPFSSFLHQSQYTLRGGRSAACEELLRRMNQANSDTRFIQLDVENFYGSISIRWLEEHLNLPGNAIRRFVLLDDVRIIRGKVPAHLQGEVNCEMDRRAIPQGSAASPLVAEFVMADILRSAADLLRGLTVITYSDNIGILLPMSADAAVMVQNLRRVFAAHGAGPFRLKTTGPRPLSVPSRFLGYDFQKEKGKSARAFVPVHVLEERETIFYGDISNSESFEELDMARIRMQSYCAAFCLDPAIAQFEERMLRFIDIHIAWCRTTSCFSEKMQAPKRSAYTKRAAT